MKIVDKGRRSTGLVVPFLLLPLHLSLTANHDQEHQKQNILSYMHTCAHVLAEVSTVH